MGKRKRTVARPSPQSLHSSPGTLGKPCTMSWSSLPEEMVREILGKLSLSELARITTTCSSFLATYRDKMAQEQEALHQLAVSYFGTKRIACLCALIVRLLKGEPLSTVFIQDRGNRCWISADGVVHGPGSLPYPATPEDIRVKFQLDASEGPTTVQVRARDSRHKLFTARIVPDLKVARMDIKQAKKPVPVALMQALLAGVWPAPFLMLKFMPRSATGLLA